MAATNAPAGPMPLIRLGAAVLILALAGGVVWWLLTASKSHAAEEKPRSEADYLASRPGGPANPLPPDKLAAVTTPEDDLVPPDGGNGSTVELQSDNLHAADIANGDQKNLEMGVTYTINGKKGPVSFRLDPGAFSLQDCKWIVVTSDPSGKELGRVPGLDREQARKKMVELNKPNVNVAMIPDPEQPAKFMAQNQQVDIIIDGDPVKVLNDGIKEAFNLSGWFVPANEQ
ncbi:MAG: hypothetical protein ACREJ2_01015 [Planctomycetota bacterium]